MKELNIVYIGRLAFPNGYATTKRRKYMVDYFNEVGISSHVLSTRNNERLFFGNPILGKYLNTDYIDISNKFKWNSLHKYYQIGFEKLREWFIVDKKNIIIFPTILNIEDLPFFILAYKLGYKIIFDKVETSYISEGTSCSWKRKMYIKICEFLSNCTYKRTTAFFVISQSLKKECQNRFPHMPLLILPNSTPIINIPLKNKLGNPVKILYTGTYAPKDGVNYLIEGVKKSYQNGTICELILLGKGKKEDMDFLKEIKDIPYIKYKGFVSDELLIQYMVECDILAMTRTNSKFSNFGFPFKLSEYLSTGNIVIATKVGDVPLYLKDKKDAFLLESESSESIAETIKYIVEHPSEALEVGCNGRKIMLDYFSIENVGKKMIDFLNAV